MTTMAEITVKVLSYNVFMRDQVPFLGKDNNLRAHYISNAIGPGDHDVIVFQEAFDNSARDKLIEGLRSFGFLYRTWVVGHSDDFDLFSNSVGETLATVITHPFVLGLGLFGGGLPRSDGGIFLLSKWPITYQGQIVYRNAGGFDARAKKGVIWALINKQGFYF